MKVCLVDGCEKSALSKHKGALGYCSAHYQRLRKHGSPTAGATGHGEPEKWLESKKLHSGDECLIWPYTRNNEGYGMLSMRGGKYVHAHRQMCRISHGEPEEESMHAAHSCGNGHLGCVNPNHLRWDTAKGNMADKVIHGRNNRGRKHPKNRLTESQVLEIRERSKTESKLSLSKEYGVSHTAIGHIVSRKNWAWLN